MRENMIEANAQRRIRENFNLFLASEKLVAIRDKIKLNGSLKWWSNTWNILAQLERQMFYESFGKVSHRMWVFPWCILNIFNLSNLFVLLASVFAAEKRKKIFISLLFINWKCMTWMEENFVIERCSFSEPRDMKIVSLCLHGNSPRCVPHAPRTFLLMSSP